MSGEQKQEYRITANNVSLAPGATDVPKGSIVKLTDAKAAALINKVQLLTDSSEEADAVAAAAAQLVTTQTELSEAQAEITQLKEGRVQAAELTASVETLRGANKALQGQVTELTDRNSVLEGANKTLQDQAAELTDRNKVLEAANKALQAAQKVPKPPEETKASTKK